MPKTTFLSDLEIRALKMARWRARTDLGYLCREILGYKDVTTEVHKWIIEALQKFPIPDKTQFLQNDVWNGRTWEYRPLCPMSDLEGERRVLILDARGHLKTTINVQAHVIQWILNYPSVAIAIWQSNIDKAELIVKEIKGHFQHNEIFRKLFPEHCPQNKILDFGTKAEFTTVGRPRSVVRREPTIMALSIDKGTAGLHFDVMKFTDIVEPENVKTPERVMNIKRSYSMAENLLVSPAYWIDIEGTRYRFDDLYGDLIERWHRDNLAGRKPEYRTYVRSCFQRKDKDGSLLTRFTPDTLDDREYPFLLDANGKRIPWFSHDAAGKPRFPIELLEAKERNDIYEFASQQLNDPRGGIDGREIFPEKNFLTISRADFRRNVAIARTTITWDTAETNSARSNYSAGVVCGWDHYGRPWVLEIVHAKWLPNELVQGIFRLARKYRPESIKIEKTSFARGLMASIQREMDITQEYFNIELTPRDNQASKEERIQNTLEPWHAQGLLRYVLPEDNDVEGRAALLHLKKEMLTFPLGTTDDILDALADQFQGREYFGREQARAQPEGRAQARDRLVAQATKEWLGIGDIEWGESPQPIVPLPL
jgi:predicted phage terminase large subunit-like protein